MEDRAWISSIFYLLSSTASMHNVPRLSPRPNRLQGAFVDDE